MATVGRFDAVALVGENMRLMDELGAAQEQLADLHSRIREIHAEAEKESEHSEAAGEIAELLAALLPGATEGSDVDPKKVNE